MIALVPTFGQVSITSAVVLIKVLCSCQVCQVERLRSTSRHDSCCVLTYLTLVALVAKEPNFSSVYSNPFSRYLTIEQFYKETVFCNSIDPSVPPLQYG